LMFDYFKDAISSLVGEDDEAANANTPTQEGAFRSPQEDSVSTHHGAVSSPAIVRTASNASSNDSYVYESTGSDGKKRRGEAPASIELPLKIVVLGGASVGKTSLLQCYTYEFQESTAPTIGFDVLSFALSNYPFPGEEDQASSGQGSQSRRVNHKVVLRFWDVSYQELNGFQHDLILTGVDGVLMVTDWTEDGVLAVDRWRSCVGG
jgi:hypothetical protein